MSHRKGNATSKAHASVPKVISEYMSQKQIQHIHGPGRRPVMIGTHSPKHASGAKNTKLKLPGLKTSMGC